MQVARDLTYNEVNRGSVSQVLKHWKSKFLAKIHVPLRKVFAETVTYAIGGVTSTRHDDICSYSYACVPIE